MKKLTFILFPLFFAVALSGYSQATNDSTSVLSPKNSKPGLINITDINVGIGLHKIDVDYSKQKLSFTSVFGIGIARNLTAGIGSGFTVYNGGALVPLFADFRYFTNIRKTQVFVFADGGVFVNSSKNPSGTMIFANPGAGMVLPLTDNLSVSFGAGLFTQFRHDYEHDSFIIIKNGVTYSFRKKKN